MAAAAVAPAPRPSTATMIGIGITLTILYLGRDVFLPLALALLLSIAMVPIVTRLRRIGLPRVPAVLFVLLLVIAFAVGFIYVLVSQAITLIEALPSWEATLRAKLRALSEGSNVFEAGMRTIERLQEAVTQPAEGTVPVTVVQTPAVPPANAARPLATVAELAGHVAAPLASLLLVLLFMTYVLLQRDDLRERFIRLCGAHDVHRATLALGEAGQRIGRYLLMQLSVNLVFGTGMGIGLWLIGVPNAPLWGLMGFVLRFIPYIGAPLSVLFPLVVSVATDPGWTSPLLVIGWFIIVDVIVTYVMEPVLYGHSTGISPFALLLSSAVWTVLWGPLGLVIAPAITACLVILGRHVPEVGWLEVVFGSDRALPPSLSAYQRLLADDRPGAQEVFEAELDEHGVEATVRDVAMPLLARLRDDRRRGSLPRDAFERIAGDLDVIANELFEVGEASEDAPPALVSVATGGALDRIAARLVAAQLRDQGQAVAHAETLDQAGAAPVVVVSAMQATTLPSLRRLAARLRPRLPAETALVIGAWEDAADMLDANGLKLDDGSRILPDPAGLTRLLPAVPEPDAEAAPA